MKVVIPLAGRGTRMRPHTHSKAKPMVRLAGKTVLEHQLDWLVEGNDNISEVILIISPHQTDVEACVRAAITKPVRIVVQQEPRGQAHAIAQVKSLIDEPVLIAFSDTLSDVTFEHLANDDFSGDGMIYVKAVEHPERFGVVLLDEMSKNQIVSIVEKPTEWVSDLAMIGVYFFRDYEGLFSAIDRVLAAPPRDGKEYFLADAISMMVQDGKLLHPYVVNRWYDTGLPDYTLAAHRFLLEKNHYAVSRPGVIIIHPSYVADDADLDESVIGPYVSVESGCVVNRSVLIDCILSEGAEVLDTVMTESLLGRRAGMIGTPVSVNIGDDSTIGKLSQEPLPDL